METKIKEKVHSLYWEKDINCARTALICLSELIPVKLQPQTINSAIGLHGAGGFRAQCGLVEGSLMFIAIYLSEQNKKEEEIVKACYNFAAQFTKEFSSLRCFDLRPNGFRADDPPHACENLTVKAIKFTYDFLQQLI
ncbi:MAG: C-GCAxxG-C-C family (seleno)protein [bacterium]